MLGGFAFKGEADRLLERDSGVRPEVNERFVVLLSGGDGLGGYAETEVCDEPLDDIWDETDEGDLDDSELGDISLLLCAWLVLRGLTVWVVELLFRQSSRSSGSSI